MRVHSLKRNPFNLAQIPVCPCCSSRFCTGAHLRSTSANRVTIILLLYLYFSLNNWNNSETKPALFSRYFTIIISSFQIVLLLFLLLFFLLLYYYLFQLIFYYYFYYYFILLHIQYIIFVLFQLFYVEGANVVKASQHKYWTCGLKFGWLLYWKTVCA